MTVSLVLVSHLAEIAEGAGRLAAQMAPSVTVLSAGGTDEGEIGTSFDKVLGALTEAQGPDGTVVLFDLGSALLTAETAAEMLDDDRVRIVDAPLVEGAIAAATSAQQGSDLSAVVLAAQGSQTGAGGGPVVTSPGPDAVTAEAVLANPLGLHARPAAGLARSLTEVDTVVLVAGSDRAWVDARSVVAVIALGLRGGDVVRVSAEGRTAEQTLAQVVALLESGFGEADAGRARSSTLSGIAAAPGTAEGPAVLTVVPMKTGPRAAGAQEAVGVPEAEELRLTSAIETAHAQLESSGVAFGPIARAHQSLLVDPMLRGRAIQLVAAGSGAGQAWGSAVEQAYAMLAGMADTAMADRAADVLDVGARVDAALRDREYDAGVPEGEGLAGAILVSEELLPYQVVRAHAFGVGGLLAARGGDTAHAAQLARALGLPAVVGGGDAVRTVTPGQILAIDGDRGSVHLN